LGYAGITPSSLRVCRSANHSGKVVGMLAVESERAANEQRNNDVGVGRVVQARSKNPILSAIGARQIKSHQNLDRRGCVQQSQAGQRKSRSPAPLAACSACSILLSSPATQAVSKGRISKSTGLDSSVTGSRPPPSSLLFTRETSVLVNMTE